MQIDTVEYHEQNDATRNTGSPAYRLFNHVTCVNIIPNKGCNKRDVIEQLVSRAGVPVLVNRNRRILSPLVVCTI